VSATESNPGEFDPRLAEVVEQKQLDVWFLDGFFGFGRMI
jgi:hypothetical protein